VTRRGSFYTWAYLQPILGIMATMIYGTFTKGPDSYIIGLYVHFALTIITSAIFIKSYFSNEGQINLLDYAAYLFISNIVALLSTFLWIITIPLFFFYIFIVFLLFHKKRDKSKTSENNFSFNLRLTKSISLDPAQVLGVLAILGVLYYIFILPDYYYEDITKTNDDVIFNGKKYPKIGTEYITKNALFALDNLPLHEEASWNIRTNSYTRKKADSKLQDVRNACRNCIDYERLISPIRVSYLKPGTKLFIKKYWILRNRGMTSLFNSDNIFVILEDKNKKTYETSGYSLEYRLSKKIQYPSRSEEFRNISLQKKKVTLSGCDKKWNQIEEFSNFFRFNKSEVKITKNKNCGELTFLDNNSQNTYLFFESEFIDYAYRAKL